MSALSTAAKIIGSGITLAGTFYLGKTYGRYRESQDSIMTTLRYNERANNDLDDLVKSFGELTDDVKVEVNNRVELLKRRINENRTVKYIWADLHGDIDELKKLVGKAADK